MKEINCQHCLLPIQDREDLVVSFSLLSLRPYHSSCYSQVLKGFGNLITNNQPVNGPYSAFVIGFSVIFAIILAVIQPGLILLSLLLIAYTFGPRLLSYYRYEQHLPK
ncbi:hypothetical protein SY83_19840 [Paenibacillus swuensis]|uniref:Permease n=1 Tax=Paenibacillus swuensis TaxID=1178515 RepID=A0A172TM71_9BACL|nr:hypothetical protein [Paenibacillus swuensis]ANE48169.1 hypothetical protein SY83_19840 [Paenibacillus swuensis]